MQIASQNFWNKFFQYQRLLLLYVELPVAIICEKIAINKSSYRKQQLGHRRLMTMRSEFYYHCDFVICIYKNINRIQCKLKLIKFIKFNTIIFFRTLLCFHIETYSIFTYYFKYWLYYSLLITIFSYYDIICLWSIL